MPKFRRTSSFRHKCSLIRLLICPTTATKTGGLKAPGYSDVVPSGHPCGSHLAKSILSTLHSPLSNLSSQLSTLNSPHSTLNTQLSIQNSPAHDNFFVTSFLQSKRKAYLCRDNSVFRPRAKHECALVAYLMAHITTSRPTASKRDAQLCLIEWPPRHTHRHIGTKAAPSRDCINITIIISTHYG
mgnify:CR=1 FL=1